MKIHINADGTINAIGYVSTYSHDCPDFITLENFASMKCINIDDHTNPNSWIEIQNENI